MKKRLTLLTATACLLVTVSAQTPVPPVAEKAPSATDAAGDLGKLKAEIQRLKDGSGLRAANDAPEEEGTRYIQVVKAPDSIQLQTAVVHFKKGDRTLDLVGAIHIADGKFYHDLNKRFEAYDALLWEGIGGPKTVTTTPAAGSEDAEVEDDDSLAAGEDADSPSPKPAVKKGSGGNLGWLHTAYISAAKSLGLTFQLNEVDYRKKNFVHADLSAEEFAEAQEKRGESLLGFMVKAALASAKVKHAQEPNSLKLIISAVRGDKNGIKRELIGTLGSADDQISQMTGESVIVTDRNAKCLQVLAEQVAAGKKNLGIFYGAAHFPDMEKRLLADGWVRTGNEWMVAWDIAN